MPVVNSVKGFHYEGRSHDKCSYHNKKKKNTKSCRPVGIACCPEYEKESRRKDMCLHMHRALEGYQEVAPAVGDRKGVGGQAERQAEFSMCTSFYSSGILKTLLPTGKKLKNRLPKEAKQRKTGKAPAPGRPTPPHCGALAWQGGASQPWKQTGFFCRQATLPCAQFSR